MLAQKKVHNILVIEDNTGDFVLVEEFLLEQFEEINLLHAKNYKEAFEILLEKCVQLDVVLLDLSLPDKNGVSLIDEIVKICKNTPVIVLTGYTDFAFGIKSLSLGVSDYLLKEELTPLSLYKSIIYSSERKKIVAALETSEKRARNLAKELNNVLEEERSRIAREIHDELGQQFSGLKMSLSSLKKLNPSEIDLGELIDTLITEVNHSIQSLRQIANELRPVIIDKLGLVAAIEWLVSGFEKKTGIVCEVYINVQKIVLDKNEEINIAKNLQQSMYTYLLRKADKYTVSFQDVDRTNALLKSKGVYSRVDELTHDSICRILGVDAVIKCRYSYQKTASEAGAIATSVLFGSMGGKTGSGSLTMQVYNAADGNLLWRFYKAMDDKVMSSADQLMERMMRKVSRNFPYEK